MSYFAENNKVEIKGEYDVIVVGGGVAGVSAALAARRNGCTTLLIEKSVMLGGLATLGLVVIYLPLCDGRGRKVIGGISEELLHLSIKYSYDNLHEYWKHSGANIEPRGRYQTVFNAPSFVVALDEVVADEGIDLLFDTVFCNTVMESGTCKGIIVENKSGRFGLEAKVIVDATGDCDVMFRSGAECVDGSNWLSYWGYSTSIEDIEKAVKSGNIMDAVRLRTLGGDCNGKGVPEGMRKFSGREGDDVTEFILEGRKLLRENLLKREKNKYCFLSIPAMAQYRTTRRIKGYIEITEEDIYKHFEDSIGCTGDWRKAGPIYEIPYRSLIAPGINNIITAGRTIASSGDVWEVTRVIPAAALTGQAAGAAAYLSVKKGVSVQNIHMPELQQNLRDAGVLIHQDEVPSK